MSYMLFRVQLLDALSRGLMHVDIREFERNVTKVELDKTQVRKRTRKC
jgi:hypothetical protein